MVEKEPAIGTGGEFFLIERIRKLLPPVREPATMGIGDDAAVIRQADGQVLLVTADMLVEDVHFDRSFMPSADLGYKSLAVNLSDIAAMGGTPSCCFLSLALPPSLPLNWFTNFMAAMVDAAGSFGVQLLGGDTVAAEKMVIAITMHGVSAATDVVYRKGGKPGDRLYVSGTLGDSALGLQLLRQTQKLDDNKKGPESFLINRHRRPQPRLQLARRLAEAHLASSMLDVSDGLLGDLRHLLAAADGRGAELFLEQLPLSPAYRKMQSPDALEGYLPALTGGEDYELLFTVPAGREAEAAKIAEATGVRISCIGSMVREGGIQLVMPEGGRVAADDLHGYDHFAAAGSKSCQTRPAGLNQATSMLQSPGKTSGSSRCRS